MLGLKCLPASDLGEPQRIPVCNCLLYRRGDPRGGAGRGQFPSSMGVAWVGSLSLGPGHSPLFSGSPVVLTVALTVCPELVFLLQKEMKQNRKNSLKALASDLDPRPRSASRYVAFGTSSPLGPQLPYRSRAWLSQPDRLATQKAAELPKDGLVSPALSA